MTEIQTASQKSQLASSDQAGSGRAAPGRMRASLRTDLLFAVLGPFLLYRLLSPHMPTTSALLLAGMLPLVRVGSELVRSLRLNVLAGFVLVTIALKIFSGLVLRSPHLQLLSDSLVIGTFGLLALASLFTSRPLGARLAEYALAQAPAELQDRFNQFQGTRKARFFLRLLTAIWGAGLLLELGLRAVLVFALPTAEVLVIGPIVRYALLGGLLLVTVLLRAVAGRTSHHA